MSISKFYLSLLHIFRKHNYFSMSHLLSYLQLLTDGAALWNETCHLLIHPLIMDRFSPMANLQKHVYVSVLKKESPKLVGDNSGPTTSLQNIVSVWD